MVRQPLLLLLLFGAGVLQASAQCCYSLSWDTDSQEGLVGLSTVRVSGVLQQTSCEKSARVDVCPGVDSAEVTVNLLGQGTLTLPDGRAAAAKAVITPKKNMTSAKEAPTPDSTVKVSTDAAGAFAVVVTSQEAGSSSIAASVLINDATVESSTQATVTWYTPKVQLDVSPEFLADTVGNTQTLTASLVWKAEVLDKSAGKASPKQGDATVTLPIEGATLTFARADQPFGPPASKTQGPSSNNANKAAAQKPANRAAPKEVEYVGFGTAQTSADGTAQLPIASPEVAGTTDIRVSYTDANNATTDAFAAIAWYDPVSLPITASTLTPTPGADAIVSVTLTAEDGSPLSGTSVTFTVTGNATVVDEPPPPPPSARQAPAVRDATAVRTTDAAGQASITLHSSDAGESSVVASYVDANGRIVTSDTITIQWANTVPSCSTILLRPRYQEAPVRRPVEVAAIILDDQDSPVKGVAVKFTITPQDGPERPPRSDAQAAAAAAVPAAVEVEAINREAVSDAQGRAVITLQSSVPGLFQVVAAAERADGSEVVSSPVLVRFFRPDGHSDYGYGTDDYHYKYDYRKAPPRNKDRDYDHGYGHDNGRKYGGGGNRKHGNKRPGRDYAETENLAQ